LGQWFGLQLIRSAELWNRSRLHLFAVLKNQNSQHQV
jgi:hypothetical protein